MRSYYTPFLTAGKRNPIYRDGTLRGRPTRNTRGFFEHMDIAEQVYEGGTPSKITAHRADANRVSHSRKRKGGEAASPTNPEKGRAGKLKKNYAGHPSDRMTSDKTCVLHGPRHSTEECKLLKEYSKKYAMQRPYKEK